MVVYGMSQNIITMKGKGYIYTIKTPLIREPMPQKTIKIRDKDYLRMKAYSEKHGISMSEAMARSLRKLEVRKTEQPESELDTCDECRKDIPKDSAFCPYCGVEFDDDDEEEED